jgi:hypothetical protein
MNSATQIISTNNDSDNSMNSMAVSTQITPIVREAQPIDCIDFVHPRPRPRGCWNLHLKYLLQQQDEQQDREVTSVI